MNNESPASSFFFSALSQLYFNFLLQKDTYFYIWEEGERWGSSYNRIALNISLRLVCSC